MIAILDIMTSNIAGLRAIWLIEFAKSGRRRLLRSVPKRVSTSTPSGEPR
jgi:hypothetical protein